MNSIKKIFLLEKKRFVSQRILFSMIACGIVLFLAFVSVGFLLKDSQKRFDGDREQVLNSYRKFMEDKEEYLQIYGENLSVQQRNEVEKEIKKYKFFLQTDTIEYDYLNFTNWGEKKENDTASCYMIYLVSINLFPLLVTAVFLTAITFAGEYNSTLKNVFAAPIRRKSVFWGKLLFLLCVLSVYFIAVFIISLIFGLTNLNAQCLVYAEDSFRSIRAVELLFQFSVSHLLLLGSFISITLLIGILSKKNIASIIFSFLIYFFLAITSMIISGKNNFLSQNIFSDDLINFFPIIGLQNYSAGFNGTFFLIAGLHLALMIGLIALSLHVFKKQDI